MISLGNKDKQTFYTGLRASSVLAHYYASDGKKFIFIRDTGLLKSVLEFFWFGPGLYSFITPLEHLL